MHVSWEGRELRSSIAISAAAAQQAIPDTALQMLRSVRRIPASPPFAPMTAAPTNGEKYGVHFRFPFAGWLNEARACLQPPAKAMRKRYALCVVYENPRTLKR